MVYGTMILVLTDPAQFNITTIAAFTAGNYPMHPKNGQFYTVNT